MPDPVEELEINPLRPGQTTKLHLHQPGSAALESFQVQIVCEDTGEHGTRNAPSTSSSIRKAVVIEEALELDRCHTSYGQRLVLDLAWLWNGHDR